MSMVQGLTVTSAALPNISTRYYLLQKTSYFHFVTKPTLEELIKTQSTPMQQASAKQLLGGLLDCEALCPASDEQPL